MIFGFGQAQLAFLKIIFDRHGWNRKATRCDDFTFIVLTYKIYSWGRELKFYVHLLLMQAHIAQVC